MGKVLSLLIAHLSSHGAPATKLQICSQKAEMSRSQRWIIRANQRKTKFHQWVKIKGTAEQQ